MTAPTSRKPVLIRADPSLWERVDSWAKGEGIARNEAVIRLMEAGMAGPGKSPEPAGGVVSKAPSPDRKPKPTKVAGVVLNSPSRPALDLPVGPVAFKPGARLKGGR